VFPKVGDEGEALSDTLGVMAALATPAPTTSVELTAIASAVSIFNGL
jgi:hypothetical protein